MHLTMRGYRNLYDVSISKTLGVRLTMECIMKKDSERWLKQSKFILVARVFSAILFLGFAIYLGRVLENYWASSLSFALSGIAYSMVLSWKKEKRINQFIYENT